MVGLRAGGVNSFVRSPLDPDAREPVEHELKVWPRQFEAVVAGQKMHEVRKFDRDFRVGDVLLLCEYAPQSAKYTGRRARVLITHITRPGTFGLPRDVGVLSIIKALTRPIQNKTAPWPFPRNKE
jgi:hypothetical protein